MKGKFQLTLMSFALIAAFSIAAPPSAADTTTTTGSTTPTSPPLSPGQSKVIGKTADTYTAFAGSRTNAENLATGLRQGSVNHAHRERYQWRDDDYHVHPTDQADGARQRGQGARSVQPAARQRGGRAAHG
jgi:hypothetical protein